VKQASSKDWLLHLFRHHAKYKKQNTKYQFWQKTNHPIDLKTTAVIDQKIEYIHNNPVEAGLVLRPECWQYSSANQMNKIDVLLQLILTIYWSLGTAERLRDN